MSKYSYDYERPAVSADAALFYIPAEILLSAEYYKRDVQVLLVKRNIEPFKHHWCVPGGYMEIHETLEDCAIRELREETGIIVDNLIPFKVFDSPTRAPDRVLAAGFIGILTQKQEPKADGVEVSSAKWFNLDEIGKFEFAFDHKQIVREAYEHFCKIIPV